MGSVCVVWNLIRVIFGTARSSFRTKRELSLENLALRHQIGVLTRALGDRRPRFGRWDRALWVVLSRRWDAWRYALAIVQPATVIRWHREGFKRFWTRRSRAGRVGRPALDPELIGLIRRMSKSNVTWGAPRIRNELGRLGIEVAVSTIARYMVRQRKPPSPSWRAFLENHAKDLVAIDSSPADSHVRSAVRVPGAGPRPPAGAALQRDREPERGVDGAAGVAGLSR